MSGPEQWREATHAARRRSGQPRARPGDIPLALAVWTIWAMHRLWCLAPGGPARANDTESRGVAAITESTN